MQLWDAATGKLLRTIPYSSAAILAFAFAPDSRYLALSVLRRGYAEVMIVDTTTGKTCWQRSLPTHIYALAFSPDRRRLVTGHSDSTILIWDVPENLSPITPEPAKPPVKTGMELLWENLGDMYATRAQDAVVQLLEQPGPAVAFLATRLAASKALTPQQIDQMMTDLQKEGEPQEKALQMAQEALANNDLAALAKLQSLDAAGKSLAVVEFLDAVAKPPTFVTHPPLLRRLRAIQVLERIGSPDARKILGSMAQGMSTGRDTRAAQEALARLKRSAAP